MIRNHGDGTTNIHVQRLQRRTVARMLQVADPMGNDPTRPQSQLGGQHHRRPSRHPQRRGAVVQAAQ